MPETTESVWQATLGDAERQSLLPVRDQIAIPAPDLLVLGGGIVGLAAAYFAAERGLRVQVVSKSRQLAIDANASLGAIVPNVAGWQFSPEVLPLAQAGRDWWAKLAVRPGFQIDWRVTGALMIDAQRLAPEPRQHMLALLEEGYSVQAVDACQIALMEPDILPCPLGGLHYPSEAVLHPLKAACGFANGIRQRGGQITAVDAVTGVEIEHERVRSIQTSAGPISPKRVILDDPGLRQAVPVDQAMFSSLSTVTSELQSTTACPTTLKRPLLNDGWVLQLKSGEIVSEVDSHSEHCLPSLTTTPVERRWSGASSRNAQRVPVIAQLQGLENVWSYGGFDFAEVMFAPIVGKLLIDWISTDEPGELAPFTGKS